MGFLSSLGRAFASPFTGGRVKGPSGLAGKLAQQVAQGQPQRGVYQSPILEYQPPDIRQQPMSPHDMAVQEILDRNPSAATDQPPFSFDQAANQQWYADHQDEISQLMQKYPEAPARPDAQGDLSQWQQQIEMAPAEPGETQQEDPNVGYVVAEQNTGSMRSLPGAGGLEASEQAPYKEFRKDIMIAKPGLAGSAAQAPPTQGFLGSVMQAPPPFTGYYSNLPNVTTGQVGASQQPVASSMAPTAKPAGALGQLAQGVAGALGNGGAAAPALGAAKPLGKAVSTAARARPARQVARVVRGI